MTATAIDTATSKFYHPFRVFGSHEKQIDRTVDGLPLIGIHVYMRAPYQARDPSGSTSSVSYSEVKSGLSASGWAQEIQKMCQVSFSPFIRKADGRSLYGCTVVVLTNEGGYLSSDPILYFYGQEHSPKASRKE